MNGMLAEQIVDVPRRRDPPAAFISEVAASIRPTPNPAEIEDAVTDLDRAGRLLVMQHTAPDVHLESTDLRVVASVPGTGTEVAA